MPSEDKDQASSSLKSVGHATPYRPVDASYWAKMPFWTPIEMACIKYGFDPEPLKGALVPELRLSEKDFESIVKRIKLGERARDVQHVSKSPMPYEWLGWLDRLNEPYPADLKELVADAPRYDNASALSLLPKVLGDFVTEIDLVKSHTNRGNAPVNPSSLTKEYNTLQVMILAAASGGYGHDFTGKRSKTAREFSEDAALIGLTLSADTARTHINKAAESHLPRTKR